MKPQKSRLWPLFLKWCAKHQVDANGPEDNWISFYETWKGGVKTGILLIESGKLRRKK